MLDRDMIRRLRRLDEYDLRRLMIFVRGLLLARRQEDFGRELEGEGAPEGAPGRVTYRLERVRCGRESCSTCPHGPYWYAYWREQGRLRSRYIGKELPGEGREA